GRRVWNTPDVLPLEAWIAREIEARALRARVPRVLSRAEDWLLWRECTIDATREWPLVNRGALGEALRRASALAADNDIETHPAPAGTEAALLYEVQRAVNDRCRSMGAVSLLSAAEWLRRNPHTNAPRIAGFSRVSSRLAALTGAGEAAQGAPGSLPNEESKKRPKVVIAPDDLTELELIAQWCKTQIERR